MENIVVLNEEQFEDIIYRTVSRCLNEKNIGNLVEKPEDEGFYDRDEMKRVNTYIVPLPLKHAVYESFRFIVKSILR